jgi:hypothetical protein
MFKGGGVRKASKDQKAIQGTNEILHIGWSAIVIFLITRFFSLEKNLN